MARRLLCIHAGTSGCLGPGCGGSVEKGSKVIRIILIILSILSLPATTQAQAPPIEIHHGTVLLYEETPTQIIVVADSRLSASGIGENTCKIIGLSQDTLFFYTGQLYRAVDSSGRELLSQQGIARQTYSATKDEGKSTQRLNDLAKRYAELVRPKMEHLFNVAWSHDFTQAVGLAGFASIDEFQRPRMVLVNIPINSFIDSGKKRYATGEPTFGEPEPYKVQMGDYPPYKAVLEFLGANTPRAEQAMKKFESTVPTLPRGDVEAHRLIAAVQASLDWNKDDPSIGPPINAAVIEPHTGVRWIQGKSRCGSQKRTAR
jgi:hypothetical protein